MEKKFSPNCGIIGFFFDEYSLRKFVVSETRVVLSKDKSNIFLCAQNIEHFS